MPSDSVNEPIVYFPGLLIESNVIGSQACEKEVLKDKNKVKKRRLILAQIFFIIIIKSCRCKIIKK